MIATSEVLILAAVMFGLGVAGTIMRKNILIILMSIELMLNSVNLTLVAFARLHGDLRGQAFAFFSIALAAAEAAIGLAIVVAIFRRQKRLDIDQVKLMKN